MFWVGNRSGVVLFSDGGRWAYRDAINETNESLASQNGNNLGVPIQVVVRGKLKADMLVKSGERCGRRGYGGVGGSGGHGVGG